MEQTIFLFRDNPIITLDTKQLIPHELNVELFSDSSTNDEYVTLKNDIAERGIQDPLHVVKQADKYLIISGHRRTEIAKELHMDVPCIVRTDLEEDWQIREALIKDNLLRRHLTDCQKVRAGLVLEPIQKIKAHLRQVATLKKGDETPVRDNCPQREEEEAPETTPETTPEHESQQAPESNEDVTETSQEPTEKVQPEPKKEENQTGRTRDAVAKEVGFTTGKQYERAKKVYEEAPDEIKTKWEKGDLTTNAALQKMNKQKKHEARVAAAKNAITDLATPTGKYQIIVIDPPWQYGTKYDSAGRRAASPYPEMTIDEIEAIEIPYDETQCVLWLWTTNKFMHEAFHLLAAWEFEPKTILTWSKSKMGLGTWLRAKTEHCILAVKGNPVIELTNETTLLEGKAREHSRKPDEFYDMVDTLCIGRKLDYFSRETREGWDTYGTMELEK